MTTRTREERATRAEARRRARLAARGELPAEDTVADARPQYSQQRQQRNFFTRIFPPAPPLPDKPDPLAGFEGSGPLRPVAERAYLLRRNLPAWLLTGAVGFIGFFASYFYGRDSILSMVGMFILFGSLIAAGWFGWQRPTLYGTAAGLLSYFVMVAIVFFSFAQLGASPQAVFSSGGSIVGLAVQAAYQAGLGFIGGWYGGYLRRRQTQVNAEARRRR